MPAAAEGEASCAQEHTNAPAAVEGLRQHAHPCLSQPVNTTTEVMELGDVSSRIGALHGIWSDNVQKFANYQRKRELARH
jgi:hypothetical protein